MPHSTVGILNQYYTDLFYFSEGEVFFLLLFFLMCLGATEDHNEHVKKTAKHHLLGDQVSLVELMPSVA